VITDTTTPPAAAGDISEADFAGLFDPAIQDMERKFTGAVLFKYYSERRRDFFVSPRMRFTQKTALNDRFELTKRWKEFAGPPVREHLSAVLMKGTTARLKDERYVLAVMVDEFASKGIHLNSGQKEFLLERLRSPEGQALVQQQEKNIEIAIDFLFEHFSANADAMIEKLASAMGIFSVSETPTNEQLWALYANEGHGFCVGFNIQHPFFKTSKGVIKGWPLFHHVTYTDSKIQDFWRNPFYFFAVKKAKWSFEDEWRMIKETSECDFSEERGGETLFFCRVLPGMIQSIVFGYDYDKDRRLEDIHSIHVFDPSIEIQEVRVDAESGGLVLSEIA
jgi:Protein of unknown function (DUF2971)